MVGDTKLHITVFTPLRTVVALIPGVSPVLIAVASGSGSIYFVMMLTHVGIDGNS